MSCTSWSSRFFPSHCVQVTSKVLPWRVSLSPAPAHVISLTLSGMSFHEQEEGGEDKLWFTLRVGLSDPLTRGCSSAPAQEVALHSAAGPPPHVRLSHVTSRSKHFLTIQAGEDAPLLGAMPATFIAAIPCSNLIVSQSLGTHLSLQSAWGPLPSFKAATRMGQGFLMISLELT